MKVAATFGLLVAVVSAKPRYNCPVDEIVLNIPDDIDCAIFYKCDHGVPVNFNCPVGLIFNPDAQICDWAFNVKHPGCLSSGQNSRPSTTTSPSYSTTAHRSGTVTSSSNINTPASDTATRRTNTSIHSPSLSTSYTRRIRNIASTSITNTDTRTSTTASLISNMSTNRYSTVIHSSNQNTSAYNATTTRSIESTRSPDTRHTGFSLTQRRLRYRRN